MVSGTGVRDFTDYTNQPWPGKIIPIAFNNVEDAGDGSPGVQWAMRVWTKDYLHSGGMETGLRMNGEDITGITNVYISGKSELYGDISGDLDNISGFNIISADTGLFSKLEGFSDIEMLDSLDFKGVYHVKGVSEISGNIVSGSQITGTNALINTANITTSNITTSNITNANITNATQDIDFGNSYILTNLASGDANGEPIRYNEYKTTETDYYITSGDHVYTSGDYVLLSGDYVLLSGDYVYTSGDFLTHTHNPTSQGGTVDHVDLSTIGTNTHAQIDTHISDMDKHPAIHPMLDWGANGFTLTAGTYGVCYDIVCSDTDADIYFTFVVKEAGTYQLIFWITATSAGVSDYAGGTIYIGERQSGDVLSWNVNNNVNADLLLFDTANVIRNAFVGSSFTTLGERLIIVRWHKDDTIDSRSGNFRIYGAYLERTA